MSVRPNGLSLIICDSVIEDARTRNKSLISMFNGILAQQVPARHDKMCAFIALGGGRGQVPITLRLCHDEDYETDLLRLEGAVDFAADDPHAVVDLVFEIRGFVFRKFGNYTFEVLHENVPVLSRRFAVNKFEGPPA